MVHLIINKGIDCRVIIYCVDVYLEQTLCDIDINYKLYDADVFLGQILDLVLQILSTTAVTRHNSIMMRQTTSSLSTH